VAERLGARKRPAIVFDEFHKYPEWKNFLKGLFDMLEPEGVRILVTGSARLDTYRKGADSLMGRYFLHRMHPLSVAEIAGVRDLDEPTGEPRKISGKQMETLLEYGGFPEPYLAGNHRFHLRWRNMRRKALFREDFRDLFRVHEIGQIEVLAELLRLQTGQHCNYASLARRMRVSENSVRQWISRLESVYYCFSIRPWSRNIPRSLRKEPKIYLWDWSNAPDKGSRNENFVASHLLKAAHSWTDAGLGDYALHYLRTKDGREVDFLVTRDGEPWMLVEVKSSDGKAGPGLAYFHERLGAPHAFHVVLDRDYEGVDAFSFRRPVTISALNLLGQMV
jgi:predicted AAA+ superfamily ATPase